MNAEELLPAVRAALAKAGGLLDENERMEIETRREEVERALALGAAQPLKTAIAALDSATQRLATLLIEQALSDGGVGSKQ